MLPRVNRVLAFLKRHLLPALLCFTAAAVLMQSGLFRRIEHLTLDERTKLRGRLEPTLAADEVAVLAIDETSIREAGRWPWNRAVHGDLLQLLSRARPAVVAWDVLFTEPTPADDYLARAMAANRAVVLGAMQTADPEDGVSPAEAAKAGVRLEPLTRIEGDPAKIPGAPGMLVPAGRLGRVASLGFVDTPPDDDGIRRTAPLVVRVGDQVYPTLSLRTLMDYWGAGPGDVTVRLGDAVVIDAPLAHRRIPIDATGAYAINYRHGRSGFSEYGYISTWNDFHRRYVRKEPVAVPALTGRIVLIGQYADGLADLGPTPFSPLTPLVLVHANIVENVLREDYLRPVPGWLAWGGMFLLSVAGLVRLSNRKPLEQALFALGVPLAFVLAAMLAWIDGSWVVALVGPLLGFAGVQVFMIGRRMLSELRAKEQIKGMFGTYVSPALVSRLVASASPPQLGGHEENITAFFSDIQDFSTLAEILPPARLVDLMNEYLTACTDIVQAEGGTLDKYIGDAMVAMFGAPVELPDHALRACVATVRVQEGLARLRVKWQADGTWPDGVCRMRSRVGLNTGPCIIGNIGSRTRFNYTMMGDNVNLAARMESGARAWGTYATCTEATRQACDAAGPGRIVFRPLGRVQVKGRAGAVPISEVVALRETCQPSTHECIALFSQGLERYYQADWDRAESMFRRSALLEPSDPANTSGSMGNPSLVYLGRVRQFRADPPGPDWQGVLVMKDK